MADDVDIERVMREIRQEGERISLAPAPRGEALGKSPAASTAALHRAIDEIRAGTDLYLTHGMPPTRLPIPGFARPLLVRTLRYFLAWQTHWNGVAARALDELTQVVERPGRWLEARLLDELSRRLVVLERPLRPDPDALRRRRILEEAYVAFEEEHRGSEDEIRGRLHVHAQTFERCFAAAPALLEGSFVVDVGCGRGEMLAVLRHYGIAAKGVDAHEGMIRACREKDLDAVASDCFEYLAKIPPDSLAGAFCCQVIEHLSLDEALELVELLHQRLRPGALCVIETLNIENLIASSYTFHLDLSHRLKIPAASLAHVLRSFGFEMVETMYLNPAPASQQLRTVGTGDATAVLLDENLLRVNHFLFGPRDYAIVARKPGGGARA